MKRYSLERITSALNWLGQCILLRHQSILARLCCSDIDKATQRLREASWTWCSHFQTVTVNTLMPNLYWRCCYNWIPFKVRDMRAIARTLDEQADVGLDVFGVWASTPWQIRNGAVILAPVQQSSNKSLGNIEVPILKPGPQSAHKWLKLCTTFAVLTLAARRTNEIFAAAESMVSFAYWNPPPPPCY